MTTYQTGKLFLIGLQPNGRLSIFERTFNRCMGLWGNGQTLWMSSLFQLWRFENVLDAGQLANGYDRLYVPQVGYTTGDIDVHDVAINGEDRGDVRQYTLQLFGYAERNGTALYQFGNHNSSANSQPKIAVI